MKRTNTNNSTGNGNSTSHNSFTKKSRNNFDEDGPSFEDELGMMDDLILGNEYMITGLDDDTSENQEARWARMNPIVALDHAKDNLAFHWLDIDMTSGNPMDVNPDGSHVVGSTEAPVPIIRMYGVTALGQSVIANIHGFTPYFYVSFPTSVELNDSMLGQLRGTLDQRVSHIDISV